VILLGMYVSMYLVVTAGFRGEREFVILLGMYVCMYLVGYVCMHVSCCHCWVSWRERVRDLIARESSREGISMYVSYWVCMYVCIL